MRTPELRRTTTFRLAVLFGAVFAGAVLLLLGLVYWRTAGVLTRRVDAIVAADAGALARADPQTLLAIIARRDADALGRLNVHGLFSQYGVHVAGLVMRLPAELQVDGAARDVTPDEGFPFRGRALARRLPWGEVLVVERDTSQIVQVRRFILEELVWSGALIVVLGLAGGAALSRGPLLRLQALQAASARIMDGDLGVRMPIAGRRDELDLFAAMVNTMVEEVERLLTEVKGANDAVAHNLRTPLARVRTRLAHLQDDASMAPAASRVVGEVIKDLDLTLERFRALLRASEIEAQGRRSGFRTIDAAEVLLQAVELYEPLAEARQVTLTARLPAAAPLTADDKLLFEAVSALLDNAIKFSPPGGGVEVALDRRSGALELSVSDQGAGIAPAERASVLQRFQRGAAAGSAPGSGLGLSIVVAIARLHRFDLRLEDANPGLRAILACPDAV